jgi:hypothetical protein
VKLYGKISSRYSIAVSLYDLGMALKNKAGHKDLAKQKFIEAADVFDSIDLGGYADMCRKYASADGDVFA